MMDLRVALRSLWRDRAFSAVSTLTIAAAIAITVAAYGVVHAVLLRPLPVHDQRRLIVLSMESRALGGAHIGLTNGAMRDFAARSRTVAAVGGVPALVAAAPLPVTDGERVIRLGVSPVTGNVFDVLQVAPARGRMLRADDDNPGALPALVVSDRAWRSEFGSRPDIVGHTVVLDGIQYTVVGVAPPGFDYPKGTDAWISLARLLARFGAVDSPEGGSWDLVGRLRPGATVAQGRGEFGRFLTAYDSPRLGDPQARTARVEAYTDVIVGDLRPGLQMLSVAVALILLIACANVAGLVLTRGAARTSELAVRQALGASPRRLVMYLMCEHALVGLVGGAIGAVAGALLLRLGIGLAPAGLARFDQVHVDGALFAFALVVAVVAVALFGALPALRMARTDPGYALRGADRVATGDRRLGRLRTGIAVAQIALAVLVLASSALLLRTLTNLQNIDPGFDVRHLLFVMLERREQASGGYAAADEAQRAVVNGLVDRLSRQPGVQGGTPLYSLPFSIIGGAQPQSEHYRLPDQATADALRGPAVTSQGGGPRMLQTLGISLIRGRSFGKDDHANGPGVAIVSESFARMAWPGQDPLGKQFQLITESNRGPMRTVVGVASDTRFVDLTRSWPTVYIPASQTAAAAIVALRSAHDPQTLVASVKAALASLDPEYQVAKAVSGGELLNRVLARPRFLATVLGALALATLALIAVGMYGVLAAIANARMREIGLRVALGATPSDASGLLIREAGRIVLAGVAIGTGLAVLGTRILRTQLFGVRPGDPVTLVFAAAVLLAVVAVSCYLPAWRTAHVDPLVVMRAE